MNKGKNELFKWVSRHSEFWGFAKVTLGVWLFYLSSLYISSSGNKLLKITMWPDMQVFFLFGAITAILYHYYYGIIYGKFTLASIFSFVADMLAYTSFYSIVLFPLSGFGVVQWLLLIYILFSSLVMKKDDGFNRYFNPIALFIFGVLMFILKSFVQYVFPPNIYQEFISGNSSARWVIFAIAGIAGCYQLVNLFSSKKTSEPVQIKSKTSQFVSFLGTQVKRGLKLIVSAGFILPLLGILVVSGFIAVFIIDKLNNDFWRILGPLLDKLLTTDRLSIINSQSLAFFQLSALILFVLYFFINHSVFEGYVDAEIKEIMKRINKYYPEQIKKGFTINDPLVAITRKNKLYEEIEEYFQTAPEFSKYGKEYERKHKDENVQEKYETFKDKHML